MEMETGRGRGEGGGKQALLYAEQVIESCRLILWALLMLPQTSRWPNQSIVWLLLLKPWRGGFCFWKVKGQLGVCPAVTCQSLSSLTESMYYATNSTYRLDTRKNNALTSKHGLNMAQNYLTVSKARLLVQSHEHTPMEWRNLLWGRTDYSD